MLIEPHHLDFVMRMPLDIVGDRAEPAGPMHSPP